MSEAIVDTHAQAAEQPLPPLLIRDPLAAWLDARGLGADAGPIEATTVGDGHSNVTYLIRRGATELVLRRPPRPPLPPSAHDVLREAQLLTALEPTPARTPKVLAACDDTTVIGAPFYVMEKVEGDVLMRALPPHLDPPAQRRLIGEQLIDALVEVHAVDWRACGLEGYGKPTGYLERQLRRFTGLWEHNRTRELPTLDRVSAWLAANRPESGAATIVHGDYRLGNTMFAPQAPARLEAIFDWELATIGDPLADVGYLAATWAQPGDEQVGTVFALGAVTMQPGFPTRDELIARYEEVSGRSMRDVRWYATLALWKAAIFLEGSYRRLLAGTTDDPFFALLDRGVPALAERAWNVAGGSDH
ncbi:phosphotransferase family protein [Conexibacter sp. JD483]|uniref:phosphotransferase family protein n=1 Tax=unclassified Conexibacter TaxID=2627773 RepID=UPI00272182C3|nr:MULTISPECIES: phosphotransferase family protein [unclassified Conexibacter]MDO8189380.1 phosphotransferase family protein [Conexibacter sp. CPCC 205706]MDO8201087.1 phosphotransferase family protein [Conexibacter sp. CPCC 205762]MDR9372451.1 phosphotransferase family protein [Conexibacter sp. JD483]